jgi:heme/copper-type cytochrome/quinol oxidase subunit 2
VEFSTPGAAGIVVTSRLYSPLAPPATSGSVGMFVPGLPSSSAKAVTALTNLMNGDFRTNIGVYNPNAVAVTATVRLFDGPVLLGTMPVSLGPQSGGQVNDIYGQLKFGALKTTNGYSTVDSGAETAPLFTYAAEADNTTQDTIFVVGAEDVPAPPGFNPPTATATLTPGLPTLTPTLPPPADTPTPTRTPTALASVVIDLAATQFQWTFAGDGANGSTLAARVGQLYQLQIRDADPPGTAAHGFSGIPSLGLSAVLLVAGGPPKTLTFTPDVTQLGAAFFSCSESTCGTGEQHDNMLGTLRVVNP